MWTPGDSHSPESTGVFDVVAVTTTSAPLTASSAEAVARTLNRRAKSSAWRGLQTRTSSNRRISLIASRWLRACTPEPMIASTEVSGRARRSVATAEEALMLGDGDHHTRWLHHPAVRKVAQRALHGGDHLFHTQQAANGRFIQVHFCISFPLGGRYRTPHW